MSLHAHSGASTGRQPARHSVYGSHRPSLLPRPLHSRCRAGSSGQQQQRHPHPQQREGSPPPTSELAEPVGMGTAENCAMQLLTCWQNRDLEGLLPFMSELTVVQAVVRQHHARKEEQKQREKQQQQQRARAQQASSSSSSFSRSYSSGLATYDSSYAPYDGISPAEAQHSVQHWSQPPQVHPPRPPCPVPGVGDSHDYIDDYESFNYAQRYGPSYVTPFPDDASHFSPPSTLGGASSLLRGAAAAAAAAQQAQAVRAPDFLSVLDAAQAGDEAHHLLDSYAMRHLILSRPAQLEPLSGMRLGSEQYVLRVRSTSLWGEKCVLTFTLKRRSEQEQRSTYSKHPHKEPWVLTRVVGEPLSWDPLEAISPEHPPEAIVAAQVQALKECDFDVAYSLTSPVGRAVAGTRDRFRAALQGDFRYQPVLMHERASSIHRTHSNANTYLEVFDVQGHPGAGSSLFIWVATRQLEGLYKNCWMVEYVTPIANPEVIKALQIGG